MPLPMRPKPTAPDEDDDPDFDPDDDAPNPFARVASSSTPAIRAPLPPVRCEQCDEKFPDAKSLGIHKTRVHFGR